MNNSDYILKKINIYFQRLSAEKHCAILDNIGCEYVPTPIELITKLLTIIKERETDFNDKKFLDVGCGFGNLCGIANNMGFKADGIELNPVLYDIAKEIYPEVRFHNVDIRTFNNYGDYDVIYYYAPLCREELQRELKAKIENDAHIGAYITMYSWDFEAIKDSRFINIYSNENKQVHIWQKIGDVIQT